VLDDVPGRTTIVSLVPEGTVVKKGEIICELDATGFEEKAAAQPAAIEKAAAALESAKLARESAERALEEFRDGPSGPEFDKLKALAEPTKARADATRPALAKKKADRKQKKLQKAPKAAISQADQEIARVEQELVKVVSAANSARKAYLNLIQDPTRLT